MKANCVAAISAAGDTVGFAAVLCSDGRPRLGRFVAAKTQFLMCGGGRRLIAGNKVSFGIMCLLGGYHL
ncbi:hypothetical protein V6N13_018764 [Hibiscus sabdariffa]|uniref:Uncharacterized protein n=1 Tax=Hibiscus sabdariffa TaxID=183260 RepID=A0ABR2EKZ1_9ROSI